MVLFLILNQSNSNSNVSYCYKDKDYCQYAISARKKNVGNDINYDKKWFG